MDSSPRLILLNALSTYGARLIAVAVGWGTARLTAKGLHVDPEISRAVTDLGAAMLASYVLAHRSASKSMNPGDAASGHVAREERELKRELVAAERAEQEAAPAAQGAATPPLTLADARAEVHEAPSGTAAAAHTFDPGA